MVRALVERADVPGAVHFRGELLRHLRRLDERGMTNAEIAQRMVVSVRTVDHHVTAILAKLGVSSRRDVVRRAAELDLL